jgi:hypothetical protein
LASATLALGSTAANATAYIGSTTACFGTACAGLTSTSTSGLSFAQGTFNQNDSNGFLSIGSGSGTDTLGLISLDGTGGTYNSPFTLYVTFTQPGSLIGTYIAAITGSVTNSTTGGVFFNFDNTPQLFTYPGGAFTLMVNDLAVSAGAANTPLNGVILSVPVPEPSTWALMLLGFGGIGLAMRRRRRPVLAQIA